MSEIYRLGQDLYYRWELGAGAQGILTQGSDVGLSPSFGTPDFANDMISSPAVIYRLFVSYKNGFDDSDPDGLFEYNRYIGDGENTKQSYNAHCTIYGDFHSESTKADRFVISAVTKNDNTDVIDLKSTNVFNTTFSTGVAYFINVLYTADSNILGWGLYMIERTVFDDGSIQLRGVGGINSLGGGKLSNGNDVYCDTNSEHIVYNTKYFKKVEEDETPDTQPDGGYGSGENPTDTTGIPNLPNVNLNLTGTSLYALTPELMNQFTAWLWTSNWQDNIKKIRTDPMENLIGVAVTDIDVSGIEAEIIMGNVGTGLTALIAPRWVTVDCGTISCDEYYGNYGDYDPYIKFTLYLPKVGFVSIPADVVVNNNIKVLYHCEISSGESLCIVYITDNRHGFSYVWNTYSCNVCANVPLSASNHTQQMIATANAVVNSTLAVSSGNVGSAVSSVASGAMNIATAKNPTQTKGNLSNMTALMSYKKPYLLVTATYLTKPADYRYNNGHAIFANYRLGDLTGYVKTLNVHMRLNAPESVIDELESILNSGFYIE